MEGNTRKETIDKLCMMLAEEEDLEKKGALIIAIRSLNLWDNFIELLAMNCNESQTQVKWMINRKGIEMIKSVFGEEIG